MKIKAIIKRKSDSGIIMIVVLWVLVILSLLALGLGHTTSMELALTKHAIGKLKARYSAWAGIVYAIEQIQSDSIDDQTKHFDTLYQCGVNLDNKSLPDVFQKKALQEGYFDIGEFAVPGPNDTKERKISFGFKDEESKINLNAVTQVNFKILSQLIVLLGFDEEIGDTIAASVVDWRDADKDVSLTSLGAEDDFYMNLEKPYHCKDKPLESVEELLLVNGVTEDVYEKVKDYVTVYPLEGNLLVNFDTASDIVLKALGRSTPLAMVADADTLADKIVHYRQGEDGEERTEDDKAVDMNQISLNMAEQTIFLNMSNYRTPVSRYLRAQVRGVSQAPKASALWEVVINRDDLAIVYFHKN